jgi:hypothetical protein
MLSAGRAAIRELHWPTIVRRPIDLYTAEIEAQRAEGTMRRTIARRPSDRLPEPVESG